MSRGQQHVGRADLRHQSVNRTGDEDAARQNRATGIEGFRGEEDGGDDPEQCRKSVNEPSREFC